jgi:hypothetical protein
MSIPSIKNQLLQEIQRTLTPGPRTQSILAPPPAYTYHPTNSQMAAIIEEDSPESDLDATHSPITIKISSPITVLGDGNLIAIDSVEMASSIAHCIVRSIKDCSMARAGIPMIDEEGRPRPIDVQVDAKIKVRGAKNTVGKKAVLFGLRATRDLKRKREQTDGDDEPKAQREDREDREMDMEEKKQKVA